MENYIVKIRSLDEDGNVYFGTGIVVGDHKVLTASHVVRGESHSLLTETSEIPLLIQQAKGSVAILLAEEKIPNKAAEIFSIHEIMDTQSTWTVYGYITAEQISHKVTGYGIVKRESEIIEWNYTLVTIESGSTQNYKGLSGAPVFSRNRIVGILQIQETVSSGVLGLRMSSVEMFQDMLPLSSLCSNEYKELVYEKSIEFSRRHIEENKRSRKYIPNIFVENGSYKERLRYFSDPVLFVKKALHECRKMDFSRINQVTPSLGLPLIDQQTLPSSVTPEQLETVVSVLLDFLSNARHTLEKYDGQARSTGLCWEEYFDLQDRVQNSLKYSIGALEKNLQYAKFQFLLLTQPAGQGKTNLLCDFTENFLLKKGYCVWYFNAYEFYEPPANIFKKKLSLEGQYDISYAKQVLEQYWRKSKRPLIIVIDGLNENIALSNFEQSLIGFLQECESLTFIKVIMSTRDEMLEDRFGRMLTCQNQEQFCHVKLNTNDEQFKHRIFNGYLKFFDVGIRQDTLNARTYQQLTEDVLLLRFFCEVHQGARQLYMYDIYKYAVFEQYCTKKAEEFQRYKKVVDAGVLFRKLLDRICAYMISNKTYFRIPMDIFDTQQQAMIQTLLENDVILKGEGVIEHGLLKERTVVISFTFDEFRDYCLTNYILRNSTDAESFLEFWTAMIDETQTVLEGIEKYTFYLARTRFEDLLLPIVKELPEYDDLYWAFIWDIEDKYITEEDILLWKKELLQEGENTGTIVRHLICKDDCTCFTIANIQLIFAVLDEFLEDSNRYNHFVNHIFGIPHRDQWGTVIPKTRTLVPFDELVNFLKEIASYPQLSQLHCELFHLSIYLYEIEPINAQCMWDQLYKNSPKLVLQLLREMNHHVSSLIRGNVYSILLSLKKRGDDYDYQILSLREENNFGKGLSAIAASIFQLFDNEDDK